MKTILILLVSIATLQNAQACKCTPPPAPLDAKKKADAVFMGKVTKVELDEKKRAKIVTVEVKSWWKGIASKVITVKTAIRSAACGYDFQEGEVYMIYAKGKGKSFSTNLCTRTRPKDKAVEDIKALGEGKSAPEEK